MLTAINRRIRALREETDAGIAMILVIGVGSVLAILVIAAIAYSIGGVKYARTSSSWNAALAAAYAGVEEYQSRLASDPSYLQYGNPAATFGGTTKKVSLPTGSMTNPAFEVGAGAWAEVPGSGGTAKYRYEVDNSKYAVDGTVRLRSTGLVGTETRSIVADLKQQGFIDFLYFTDYEIQDPEQSGAPKSCATYAWAGRPDSGCSNIAFGSFDTINGPAHSNDAIRACGARFKGAVTTAYSPTTGPRYIQKDSNNNACSAATFEVPGSPAYSPLIGMPSTNSQIKKETRSDLPVEVPLPGCLYSGPTNIVFNSNGTMTVKSPWTKFTRVAGDPATSGTNPAECGAVGTGSNSLGSSGGATITVPKNNVVYVQNVPSVSSDPNFWASTAMPKSVTCVATPAENTADEDAMKGNPASNGAGYPIKNEVPPSGSSYGCRNGDAFVKGTMAGRLTIAAENFIYVTGDVRYASSQDDMLGLIGQNAVFVYNPVDANNRALLSGINRRIDAAILSVAHTFQVQNYYTGGNRGVLEINGAIAQKFRGIVRGGPNGYAKAYNYDPRLKYTAPPKFLSPVTTTYGVNVWVEISPVFDNTGGYR